VGPDGQEILIPESMFDVLGERATEGLERVCLAHDVAVKLTWHQGARPELTCDPIAGDPDPPTGTFPS
jgi:hypothetical protein